MVYVYIFFFSIALFFGNNVQTFFHIPANLFRLFLLTFALLLTFINKKYITKSQLWLLTFVFLYGIFKLITDRGEGTKYAVLTIMMPFFMYSAFPKFIRFPSSINQVLQQKMIKLLFFFFIVEVGIAILERIIGTNVFPWHDTVYDISYLGGEFRSVSLHGHPLENALIVSTIMSFILISPLKNIYKLALWGAGFISIMCFNSRSAMVLNVFALLIYLGHLCMARSVLFKQKIRILLAFGLVLFAIGYLFFNGYLGARLMEYGLNDNSSQVRLDAFALLDDFKICSNPFGVSLLKMQQMQNYNGLYSLENYWLIWLFRFGIVFLVGFVAVCFPFFKSIYHNYTKYQVFLTATSFIILSSTTDSLASDFAPLFIYLLCIHVFNPKSFNLHSGSVKCQVKI